MTNQPFTLGKFNIYWLNGGSFKLDGGCMFGVVPKVLWRKKFPGDADGSIILVNRPILIHYENDWLLIETGLGNKLTAKQQQIFQVEDSWQVLNDLHALGISRHDVTKVILTHGDFDHLGGAVMVNSSGKLEPTFPGAEHYFSQAEWADLIAPNRRSASSYWPINYEVLEQQVKIIQLPEDTDILPGISLVRTGGHTRGHMAVWLRSEGETAVHLGDLLANHAYFNPLWITPYDNYPLESIAAKEKLLAEAARENSWFLFYHDPYMTACRLDDNGQIGEKFIG